MKIAVLTYDVPHRKTQDLLMRLLVHPLEVIVIATPFSKRKQHKCLYKHRPDMDTGISTKTICERVGYTYIEDSNIYNPIINEGIETVLIGGSGIIKLDERVNIINSHPGYLPFNRGLDALKWAIYEGYPVGVTTHVIDDNIDLGKLIDQRIIKVGYYDTFHSLAYKQYQLEIEMLADAVYQPIGENILADDHKPKRRMPMELEPIMMERFNKRRKASSV